MKNYLQNNFDPTELVDVFDELPLWSAPFGLKLFEYIRYQPGLTALDVGCGTGFPLTELAMRLGSAARVFGVDPWSAALDRVRKKIAYYQIKNVTLIEGGIESVPLEDASVDLITSNNGLNNVADMDRAVGECARLLRRGGQFIQTMNTDKTMFEFYEALEGALLEFGLESSVELMRRHIAQKRPSVDGVLSLLQKHGFRVNRLVQDQFDYRFVDASAMFNHYFIRLAFMESWINLVPSEKVEPVFEAVERRMNASAQGGVTLGIPFVLIDADRH